MSSRPPVLLPLAVLGLFAFPYPMAAAHPRQEPDPAPHVRPNLILVISDDQRWDTLGAAGNPNVVTPVLDRLAREGVYFRQATVSVSQCHPVRASLITGLPTHRHGVYSRQAQAPGAAESLCRRPTLPGLLADHGYHTVMVGKWHLTPAPWECGFRQVASWIPGGGALFERPFLVRGRSREPTEVEGYTQQILVDDAIEFLSGPAAQESPFLLWLALTAPHAPYAPNPPDIRALYAGRAHDQLLPPAFPRFVPANNWRLYNEAVSFMDQQLGRLLEALTQSGLEEETLLLFVSDNGYMMGERGIGGPESGANGKVVPYESSLRVPMILWGSPVAAGAGPSDLPASTLDLPPTLLALAGVAAPEEWPGRDLQAALAGSLEIEEAFSEWADDQSVKFGPLAFRAVRTPRHKLIDWQDPDRPDELYDLVKDPAEVHNRWADASWASTRRDLQRRLAAWLRETGDPAVAWVAEPEPEAEPAEAP